jgi:beta-galactosidase
VQGAAFTAAGTLLAARLRIAAAEGAPAQEVTRIDTGWEFFRGALKDAGEAWRTGRQWQPIGLPHCFNAMDSCDPDISYYRGQGWYRTRLALENPFPGGRTILHFQGAGQTCTAWSGSAPLGEHKGGYNEFCFDISETARKLTPAERRSVPIAVCCDNSPDCDRLPSELSDFCLYGGLYRRVNLIYLPAVALDAVHVLPIVAADGSAQIQVNARLYNPGRQNCACQIVLEVLDPGGRVIYQSRLKILAWNGFAPVAEFRVDAPELWSPDSPHLYLCRLTLSTAGGEMQLEERFGIRHFEFVEHGAFRLNGQRLLLRGTQRHADHAGLAAAMPDELVREEMRMIREMGANFIRLAHYQQDRLVLDLCDELGLIVWEELPWCRSGVGGPAFRENARQQLTQMIEQHFDHPSIVFWGLGNEDDWPEELPSMDKPAIRAFMDEMNALAHQLDNSRLTALRRCEFARDIPDVYSPSIWAGWYHGQYREYEQSLVRGRESVKRFMHVEWGADSHAGRHAEDPEAGLGDVPAGGGTDERDRDAWKEGGPPRVSSQGDWSETYACNLFEWHLMTQEKLDWLSGAAQWIFKDFASPLRGDNCIPRVNQKGVVERDLRKKESYYVFQSWWAQKPMVHIYGHSWPMRWGAPGQARQVRVYSNCERVELFLNGVSAGTKMRDGRDFPAAGRRWDLKFVPGPNRLRAVASQGNVVIHDDIEFLYETRSWGKPTVLRLAQIARDDGRVTVEAKLFDANGVVCLNAANVVRFSLYGEGRLIDNLGATRGSRELQLANGRAEISLATRAECVFEATVEGVPVAKLSIRGRAAQKEI